VKEILIILGFFDILVSIILYYIYQKIIKNSSLNYWIIGFIIAGLSFVLYSFYEDTTNKFEIFYYSLLFNFFPMIGNLLFINGHKSNENKKHSFKSILYLSSLSLLFIYIFTFIYFSDALRMISNSIVNSFAFFYIAYSIRNKNQSKFYRNRFVYVTIALIQLTRIFQALLINQNNFMPNHLPAKIVYILSCLATMIIFFNIILVLMTDINNSLLNQLKTKDKIYMIISHDIKGQLNNIINYSYILKDKINEWNNEKINSWITDIESDAYKTYSLTENMLYWSADKNKIENAIFKVERINEILNKSLLFFSSSIKFKNQKLELQVHEIIELNCDTIMIETIFRNLIENAIKNSARDNEILIKLFEKENFIHFEVENEPINHTAIDIIHKNLEFDHYSEIKGHGLLISKEFVDIHRGTLDFNLKNNRVQAVVKLPKTLNYDTNC